MASGNSFLIAILIGVFIFGYLYFLALHLEKNIWWIAPMFLVAVLFLMKDASSEKKEMIKILEKREERKIDFW